MFREYTFPLWVKSSSSHTDERMRVTQPLALLFCAGSAPWDGSGRHLNVLVLFIYRTDVPHSIKVKVVVGLSTKIKKTPGRGFLGGRFFFLIFSRTANYSALFLHDYDFHSSQSTCQPRCLFIKVMPRFLPLQIQL